MQQASVKELLSWGLKALYEFHWRMDNNAFGLDTLGCYSLKGGKTTRLNVQKLLMNVLRTMQQMEQIGDQAMVDEISDRQALAACKCEEVLTELILAKEILQPLLGKDWEINAGDVAEEIEVPTLTFSGHYLNQIAILAGPNARLKEYDDDEIEL